LKNQTIEFFDLNIDLVELFQCRDSFFKKIY